VLAAIVAYIVIPGVLWWRAIYASSCYFTLEFTAL